MPLIRATDATTHELHGARFVSYTTPRTKAPGDTLIVNPGSTLAVENPADHTALTWVTTSIGLSAVPADDTRVTPPWAN
ncbi:hypothetical protein IAG44_31710 [Streptomyces roseirectus]|uniref:Uncharacterized protein n=1 Tax=Streptomyces roseirectus TaxID=2768066 RepID=A0A7H0ILA4_9ACTN|nr:hypothetical protein [Streptomyces roseirectus]QNP73570.1 hypothetical protein IAG44_31710 [Streptomyces roseirectus]